MTFTYTPSTTPTDLTKVRYTIQDTDSTVAMYTDEEINMVLAIEGTVGAASVSLLKRKITELSNNPNMQADWLRVDWSTTLAALKVALAEVKTEFGLGWQSSSGGQHSYRPDSLLKEAPDYGEE